MKILAISGSLRLQSINTMVLRAASSLSPEGVEITLFEDLGSLPLFNADLDGNEPEPVIEFRKKIAEADGVLISSPEYAHGVSGVMKNALDWVVSSGELSAGKPVAVLNTSYSSTYADTQLKETLRTMDAYVVSDPSMAIPVQGKHVDEAELISHPELGPALENAVASFVAAIKDRPN
jgi:chromate reductase, NAD(P)H dehydrogenase (quinone)